MFRQEIKCEMIWQNDGRRSDPLVSWGAEGGRETERKKMREQCGMGKPENNRSILAPYPSLLPLLATFCAALQLTT